MKTEKEGESLPFSFHGTGGDLFGIHFVNLFLTLLTLGVYFFWAKVKVRKYLWGQVEVAGDRFSYHGTAQEILLGWLKALLFFGLPYLLLREGPALAGLPMPVVIIGGALAGLLLLAFIPYAVVGTRRYRLSRTSWRNVRFSFTGRPKEYAVLFLKATFLTVITLGFYSPYWLVAKNEYLLGHTRLGDRDFHFKGRGEDLFPSYVAAVLLAIPTLFFSLIWYWVKATRYTWEHTRIGDANFKSELRMGKLVWLSFTNVLLTLVTLGFGAPWAQARMLRYTADCLSIEGEAGLDSIGQDAKPADATGEEVGDFLDMDFDLG